MLCLQMTVGIYFAYPIKEGGYFFRKIWLFNYPLRFLGYFLLIVSSHSKFFLNDLSINNRKSLSQCGASVENDSKIFFTLQVSNQRGICQNGFQCFVQCGRSTLFTTSSFFTSKKTLQNVVGTLRCYRDLPFLCIYE